jgi:hypothetical protein
MTTAEIPVSELRKQAASVRPGRVAATVILWLFVALGWILGTAWRLTVFLALLAWHRGLVLGALSVRYGYWKGLGLTEDEILERVKVKAEPAPPPAR